MKPTNKNKKTHSATGTANAFYRSAAGNKTANEFFHSATGANGSTLLMPPTGKVWGADAAPTDSTATVDNATMTATIDPTTGLPVDPTTGFLTAPTGALVVATAGLAVTAAIATDTIDSTTGLPVDPTTGLLISPNGVLVTPAPAASTSSTSPCGCSGKKGMGKMLIPFAAGFVFGLVVTYLIVGITEGK